MRHRRFTTWIVGTLIIGLVLGCSDDICVNNKIPDNRIGPDGGEYSTPGGGARLAVPAGALQNEVDFTIEENDSPEPAFGTMKHISTVYSIGPAGTVFAVPATVRISYNDTELGNIPEESVVLCTTQGGGGGWEELPTALDSANNYATATATHLSDFAVMIDTVRPATVEIGGTITGDTTWTVKDTILVTETVTVAADAELTIEAGTLVMFTPGTGLSVAGRLTAVGEENNRIRFTASADTTCGTPLTELWNGVNFQQNSDGTVRYCVLRYAGSCLNVIVSSPEIAHCEMEYFLNNGIYVDGYYEDPPITVLIENCVIRDEGMDPSATRAGIFVYRAADVTIADCAVSGCSYGLEFKGLKTVTPNFQVTGCLIRDHSYYGIYAFANG